MSFPESSPLKKIPKQEPTTRAIRQIRRIMTTATHPPAAMAAIKPFTAAIVVLTAVTVAWIAAFTPVTVAFAAALAAWADALADFAVACAVFCAVLAACCAAFDERCAVLIPLTLCFKLFTDRPAVFTTFCGLPLTARNAACFVRILEAALCAAFIVLPVACFASESVREISCFSLIFRVVACASFFPPR